MLSPKNKRKIYRIIPFGLIWLFFSLIYTQLERGLMGHLKYYPATGNPYNFPNNVFITSTAAFITGLLMGILEAGYFNRLFAQKSFTKKIVYKSVSYLFIIVIFVIIVTIVANVNQLHAGFFSKQVWAYARAFFTDYSFVSVVVYIAAIIVVVQFYSEVSDNLGQEVLNNFFTGKYHRPAEEERIFMFLDMKSSTAIAESLGHVAYFEMLRAYYSDLTEAIITHSGEIYQYVGDEIVVTWKLKNGLQNNNCIQCFFAMKEALQKQKQAYTKKFGLLPAFKAGLHFGKVTTGEIGVIKKEIIFTGDTLNTTARIQSLCNGHQVDILISGSLVQALGSDAPFQFISLGQNELKGRDEKMELFTILPAIKSN